jgi:hypothetical protein
MAPLHATSRCDRLKHDVVAITARPSTSVRETVARHAERLRPKSQSTMLLLKVKPMGIGRKEDALTMIGLIKTKMTVYDAAVYHDT